MSILSIRIYGDPVLREKAAPVDGIDDEVRTLAADMLDTVRDAEGVGLAGPQIGVPRRIIVVHPPPPAEGGDRGEPTVLVNPEILSKGGPQESAEEGCLSIPGIYEVVKRPRQVSVTALGLDGKEIRVDAEGIHGRILQHEIDHLDGVLFVDRIGPMRRALLKKQLRAFLD
ncbi:peptide deformylase [bacterium]|nr:peptide deformylase [bacterium]